MPHLPNPHDIVPDPVYHRFWDFIVQGVANLAGRGGHPDWARKVENGLRVNPNEERLVKEAVADGWRHWLRHSQYSRLTEAIRRDLNDRMPTLLRVPVERTMNKPLWREEVEVYLAQWFHALRCGLSLIQCRQAARELAETVLVAALDGERAALRDGVLAVLAWDRGHQAPMPRPSARAELALDHARALATGAAQPVLSAAHLFYGITMLTPPLRPQQALVKLRVWLPSVEVTVRGLRWERMRFDPKKGPMESTGLRTMCDDAAELAREAGAEEYSDEHLLSAALELAMDANCADGESLRVLFKELPFDAAACVAELQAAGGLNSGYFLRR